MLYVRETGVASTSTPSIVFLHGGGLSSHMWEPQFERLSDFHCLAPDLPEQGKSAHIRPFILEDAARRIVAIINERVPSKRSHVVGLSLGGAVALTMLRIAPECVDHMIVSGTSAGMGKALGWLLIAGGVMYRFMSPQALLKAAYRQFAIPPQYEELVRDDLLLSMNEVFNTHTAQALMDLKPPTAVTAPILVAVGEKETFVAKSDARKLVGAIQGARGIIVPGVGHVWNLQAPDLFADMVRTWSNDKPLPDLFVPLM
jgi:pimeloyl-ACP methyl ester carboxylesterase